MPSQSWRQTLASQQSQGTLFNTYTTAKTVLNPQALYTFPAGFFQYAGQRLTVHVEGGISNIVTTPGTITLQVMLGSVVVFTTGAVQLNATAHTTLPFVLDVSMTLQTVGNSTNAKFAGMGTLSGIMFTLTAAQVDAVNTSGLFQVPVTAPAQGTGFDSTSAQILDFWAGFSISNAGNGIQLENYVVSSDN